MVSVLWLNVTMRSHGKPKKSTHMLSQTTDSSTLSTRPHNPTFKKTCFRRWGREKPSPDILPPGNERGPHGGGRKVSSLEIVEMRMNGTELSLSWWPFSTLNLPSRPKPAPKPKPKPLEIIPDEPRKLSDPAVKPMVRKLPQRKLSEVLPLTQPPTWVAPSPSSPPLSHHHTTFIITVEPPTFSRWRSFLSTTITWLQKFSFRDAVREKNYGLFSILGPKEIFGLHQKIAILDDKLKYVVGIGDPPSETPNFSNFPKNCSNWSDIIF